MRYEGDAMRILMLGNSFTTSQGLPDRLAELLDAEVVVHARGGARLAEQLNPKTKMGARTLRALAKERWDCLILQEMSTGPLVSPQSFERSVEGFCSLAHEHGAVPVLFETWACCPGSKRMDALPWTFEEMHEGLVRAYRDAASAEGALLAEVGEAFFRSSHPEELYAADGRHPSTKGAALAAEVLAQTIEAHGAA